MLGATPTQIRLDEASQVAVQNSLNVADLMICA